MGKGEAPCAVTEYKNEFRGHPIERTKAFKPDYQYKNDSGPIQDETTHKYKPKLILRDIKVLKMVNNCL